ncbi:hypothetical protein BHM03_00048521 [Ensete ventricosum]|nr:hypothetical protein BHM03_00048521 [Ensete ventricosum]
MDFDLFMMTKSMLYDVNSKCFFPSYYFSVELPPRPLLEKLARELRLRLNNRQTSTVSKIKSKNIRYFLDVQVP